MRSPTTRAMIALAVGGLLSLAAFLGTFFWAGVPDFGTYQSPEKADSLRYRGPFEEELAKPEYLANYEGFEVTVVLSEPVHGETVLEGTLVDAADEGVAVETDAGTLTAKMDDVESATVRGHSYGRADWGQKIFYFHVPVAEISFLAFGFAAFYSIRFLMTRKREYDTKARIGVETTLVFVTLTMITGILWTKAAWGVWWEWEPRLTTYFILTLLVIGYFVLRNAVEDEERRALYAAAFCILGFIDVPISFFITRFIPSSHPVIERGGLEPPMLITFIVAQVGLLLIGYAVYRLRMGEVLLAERLERAKSTLEG